MGSAKVLAVFCVCSASINPSFVDLVYLVPGSIQMLAGYDGGDIPSPVVLTAIHGVSSLACGAVIGLTSVSAISLQVPREGGLFTYLCFLKDWIFFVCNLVYHLYIERIKCGVFVCFN